MKSFRPKRFRDIKVSKSYTTFNKIGHVIKYKMFNNYVDIDLKEIVDLVLQDAGITGFDTKQLLLSIPFNIEDVSSGNSIKVLVDNKRFHIRLPEMQALITKQQKIGFDNTYPHRWNNAEWVKFIEDRFWETFGYKSVELDFRGNEGQIRKGRTIKYIDKLRSKIKAIEGVDFDDNNVVEYIRWVFSNKSKTPLTIPLIICDGIIQEWIFWRNKKCNKGKVGGKWD